MRTRKKYGACVTGLSRYCRPQQPPPASAAPADFTQKRDGWGLRPRWPPSRHIGLMSFSFSYLFAIFSRFVGVFSSALLLARSDSTSYSVMSLVCPSSCLYIYGRTPLCWIDHPLPPANSTQLSSKKVTPNKAHWLAGWLELHFFTSLPLKKVWSSIGAPVVLPATGPLV